MQKKYDMHVIMNTHWDREWRWSFRETQMRLVTAMDMVLDGMAQDERFHAFHTDAQASVSDDYLELRPERKEELIGRVKEGRLQIGPWYTLPAEFLVSSESLTRNLLLGHKISNSLGGAMKCAYNIFSWGQVSQLPQLYRQFGMETIIFYRGVDQEALDGLEFWWEAPDGKKSLGLTFGSHHRLNFWVNIYRPWIMNGTGEGMNRAEGKGFTVNLADPESGDINHWLMDQQKGEASDEQLREWTQKLIDTVKDKSSTDHLLFFQGFDLENPDLLACDLVDKIRDLGFGDIKISTLPEAFKLIEADLKKQGLLEQLPTLKGEMLEPERQDARFGQLFPGVWAARMPVKLANARSESALEKWAEPSAAWASMTGGFDYPVKQINVAWKELLKNQQHDGIGGCHVDRVQLTMMERNRDADDLAHAVTRNAIQHLVAGIDCGSLAESDQAVIMFNPCMGARNGVVEVIIDVPAEYLSGSSVYTDEAASVVPKNLSVRDAAGNSVRVQVLDQWKEVIFTYRKFAAHWQQPMRRFQVYIDAGELPPMGYKGLVASVTERIDRSTETLSPQPNVLENDKLHVAIAGDGSITLENKATGSVFKNLHYWEDEVERGNPLMHLVTSDRGTFTTVGQPAEVSCVFKGPLATKYRIDRTWMLPEKMVADLRKFAPQAGEWLEADRPRRAEQKVAVKISTEVLLRKGSDTLEFKTVIDNRAEDHRLRLILPTGLQPEFSTADSPYDVVRRPVAVPDASSWDEPAMTTWPSCSWVDVSDGTEGLAFAHQGIPEYEVIDNGKGDLAITFLRAFGIRGGQGESYEVQTGSQCLGESTFSYAIKPHSGDWQEAGVYALADAVKAPVKVAQTSKHAGSKPLAGGSFISMSGDPVVITALKRAEDENGFILRGFNPFGNPAKVVFTVDAELTLAEQVLLEELTGTVLPLIGSSSFEVNAGVGEIFSVRLVLK